MSATTALFIVLGVWVTIGIVASIFMGRRGHNPFAWLVFGTIFGPLVVPVAIVAVSGERIHQRREIVSGLGAGGIVDVLVGIDGSPESKAALRAVGRLFGPLIGRLTLATVEDFDSARAPEHHSMSKRKRSRTSKAWHRPSRPNSRALSSSPVDRLML
jgi:hypothetical protein